MEEEKAAAYYDELTRKGEGAARFKQGLGFSSTSNDAVPIRGSALVSSSSFLGSFVRASSPSKTTEFEKQAQLQTIQNKLKNKPKDCLSCRVSTSPSREKRSSRRSPSRSHKLRRRSRSRNRDKERHSRWSENRDAYRSKRPHRSTSRSRSRSRDRYKHRQKEKQNTKRTRSVSPRDQRPGKVGKDRAAMVDYSKLIEGYQTTVSFILISQYYLVWL